MKEFEPGKLYKFSEFYKKYLIDCHNESPTALFFTRLNKNKNSGIGKTIFLPVDNTIFMFISLEKKYSNASLYQNQKYILKFLSGNKVVYRQSDNWGLANVWEEAL